MKKILLITFSILVLTLFSNVAIAQDSTEYESLAPLPQTSNAEGMTTASQYIPGVVKFIIGAATVLAVLKIMFGGIQYMSTDAIGGKKEGISHVKDAMWGLLLIISSYLILNTLNPKLVEFDLKIKELQLGSEFETELGNPGAPGRDSDGDGVLDRNEDPGSNMRYGCVDCEFIDVPHKYPNTGCWGDLDSGTQSRQCLVNSKLNNKLVALHGQLKTAGLGGIYVTESFPPTVHHQAPCHHLNSPVSGMCVDARFTGPTTAENIEKFIELALQVGKDAKDGIGLCAVYEVPTEEEERQLERAGLDAGFVIVVEGVAPHFSVYGDTERAPNTACR